MKSWLLSPFVLIIGGILMFFVIYFGMLDFIIQPHKVIPYEECNSDCQQGKKMMNCFMVGGTVRMDRDDQYDGCFITPDILQRKEHEHHGPSQNSSL